MNNDYTIAEDYTLPSLGKIYDKEINPNVKLRSMTVREEMKRLSQSNVPNRNICEIIDDCLITKLPIKTYDLCLGDYEYLLHKLRVVSYGPEYKMVVGCPHENCKSIHEETLNLDDLKLKKFNLDEFKKNSEFTLPISKKVIKIKYKTARMVDDIILKINQYKKENPNISYNPEPLINLEEIIETVDGLKLSYAELESFITNLGARDYNYIMLKSDKLNSLIGLDTHVTLTCSKCGGQIDTFFRVGQEFFRPTIDE